MPEEVEVIATALGEFASGPSLYEAGNFELNPNSEFLLLNIIMACESNCLSHLTYEDHHPQVMCDVDE